MLIKLKKFESLSKSPKCKTKERSEDKKLHRLIPLLLQETQIADDKGNQFF
jgi:hypothetical protein